MSKWIRIPSRVISDDLIKDGELRTLIKLCDLARQSSGDKAENPMTDPLFLEEFIEAIGISRASYFRHIRILSAREYIHYEVVGSRFRIAIITSGKDDVSLTRETVIPISTLTSVDSNKSIDLKEHSTRSSPNLTRETRIREALVEAGIGEPLRTRLVEDPDAEIEWIEAHIRYTKLRKEPTRNLAYRLRDRSAVPTAADFVEVDPDSEEARSRYATMIEDQGR